MERMVDSVLYGAYVESRETRVPPCLRAVSLYSHSESTIDPPIRLQLCITVRAYLP